jgi:hypothetical protein
VIREVASEDLATARESDEGLLALVARLWGEVAERLPQKARVRKMSFGIFLAVLALVESTAFDLYGVIKDRREATEQATERAENIKREDQRDRALKQLGSELQRAPSGPRWRTNAVVVLRADPDSSAPTLGRLPSGIELVERQRLGRWIAADVVNPSPGIPSTGWVYQRNLTLVPQSNGSASPTAGASVRP